jgi:hypothetical protein
MGPDRSRSPEKSDRKPAKEREITPSDDTKAVSTQNEPVFRGVQLARLSMMLKVMMHKRVDQADSKVGRKFIAD